MAIGVDMTGMLGERIAGLTIKSPAVEAKKHIFLHCNASNLVLKILQRDKIWGTIPHSKFWGTCPQLSGCPPPVIYAHVYGAEQLARPLAKADYDWRCLGQSFCLHCNYGSATVDAVSRWSATGKNRTLGRCDWSINCSCSIASGLRSRRRLGHSGLWLCVFHGNVNCLPSSLSVRHSRFN